MAVAQRGVLGRRALGVLAAALLGVLLPVQALAEPHVYALVVGANRGGYGQAPLRYAADDARQFAALLVELGRAPHANVQVLLDPTPAAIEQTLSQLRSQLARHAEAGEHSKLLFYYSGHARARSLSLGGEELALDALRAALLSLPSTLTVAVLDACQSGAFSGIKGAVPAADFSSSSISDLNNAGVAVMASSTAAELSQESPELGASYFTHHLVTGMRGAADRDRDGSVSLDEAYSYAYHNTLSDTLRTRVGSQHATLEMELKGHGSVPLTYTADADAQLRLSEVIEGRIVVQRKARGAVVAELSKAPGSVLSLALPHGEYEVLVRRGIAAAPQACTVLLAQHITHNLETRNCPVVIPPAALAAKGDRPPFERWFLELGAARRFASDDKYIDAVHDFGFEDRDARTLAGDYGSFTPTVAGGVGITPNVSVLARFERLATRSFERKLDELDRHADSVRFSYQTWAFGFGARGRLPLLAERLVPFLELDLGLATAGSKWKQEEQSAYYERYYGPWLRVSVGLTAHLFWRIGALLSAGYDYAPALSSDIRRTHDDGGLHVGLSLRLRGLTGGT